MTNSVFDFYIAYIMFSFSIGFGIRFVTVEAIVSVMLDMPLLLVKNHCHPQEEVSMMGFGFWLKVSI